MRIKDAFKVLNLSLATRLPAMLVGQPGVGKTSIVKQAANAGVDDVTWKLQIMHPSVSDPTDFKGFPFVVNGNAEFLPFGDLRVLRDATEPTIAFLDDLGQAPPSVQAACMQLILERRIGQFQVSDQVLFMAATNRASDKAGVAGLLEPVKSRFGYIIELEPNVDDWITWAISADIPIEVVMFIRFRPQMLTAWKPEREIRNQPSPRTIEFLARTFQVGVPDDIAMEAYMAVVGEACAAEFLGFLKLLKILPDIEKIYKDPDKAAIPSGNDADATYAIVNALILQVKPENFDATNRYIRRLPDEFKMIYIQTIRQTHPEWTREKSFAAFAPYFIKFA